MSPPPSVLLFELEGIVADTRAARRAALDEALRALDVRLAPQLIATCADGHDEHDATALALAASQRLTQRAFDDTDVELAALRAARAFEARLAHGVTLVPRAREALLALAARVRLGVVTRLSPVVADRVLTLAGLDAVVASVIARGPQPVGARWPTADVYRGAARRLAVAGRVAPEAVVVLSDTPHALDAAREAGLRAVAVGDGATDATSDARLASVHALTYDALVDLLASRGVHDS